MMTIAQPLLTLVLAALLVFCIFAAFRWKVFVKPSEETRRLFRFSEGTRVKDDTLTMFARVGWTIAAIVLVYFIGTIQGWVN